MTSHQDSTEQADAAMIDTSLLCAGEAQMNKSGTTSQVIAHPKGGGAIKGLGERKSGENLWQ